MSTSFPVHTVEDIIAAFGLKDGKITPIDGEPTLQTLIKAHNKLCNASIKIRHCARGNFGYLYLVELPVVYATWSTSVTLKIQVYRANTGSRQRNAPPELHPTQVTPVINAHTTTRVAHTMTPSSRPLPSAFLCCYLTMNTAIQPRSLQTISYK